MTKLWLGLGIGASLLVVVVAIGIGSVHIPSLRVLQIVLNPDYGTATERAIIHTIRLPRVLMAYVAGAGLSISGVLMQSVLKNPLASTFTLGTSTGAAVGASLAILLGVSVFGVLSVPVFGFSFAMATVVLAIGLASRVGGLANTAIVLVGMALTFLGGSLITILMVLNQENMQRLIFWQMGSVAGVGLGTVLVLAVVVSVGLLLGLAKHRELDILTLDDTTASALGLDIKRAKWYLLCLSALITGLLVSFVGIIGFVDLFTPPLARKAVGSHAHRYVLPMAGLMGGSFLVLSDVIARTLFAPIELPIGAVTALIGGPLFILIYVKGGHNSHANT